MLFERLRRRWPARSPCGPALTRFGHAQALAGAADALVAVSLAGSLFFSLSPDASQQQVFLYLVINMAPFALLAPLIGPAIDRFPLGRRWIAASLFVVRAACAIALAFTLLDLALYFFALALLLAAKASGVTRQALIPGLVGAPDELVAANSRLARLNVIAGAIGGAIGAALLATTSPTMTLAVASAAFVAAGAATLRVVDRAPIALVPAAIEYEELHSPTIVASAWAFTVVRAAVGFFVFGLAFALRRGSEPAWMYGAAVVAYGVGTFGGNTVAPLLRRRYREDTLISGSLVALAMAAGFGALGPSRTLVLLTSLVLGAVASVGRQCFDSLVQTRAPQASRGRSFARFETRFQLGWVAGAIVATAIGVPIQISLAVVAVALVPAAILYRRSLREAHLAHAEDPYDPIEVARRRLEHAAEWRRRGLDRVVVSELASVVELVRATGAPVDADIVDRLSRLRLDTMAGLPTDALVVDLLMAEADTVLVALEQGAGADRARAARQGQPDAVDDAGTDDTDVADPLPSPPPPSPAPSVPISCKDVDVTDHASPDRATVTTPRDHSSADR
ncbi:MAG: MFS transporter [Actinomycetota bacterium]|nr:MFS transporter [Actinomycetota bacterium]